jgi:hypothetical protein
LWHFESDEGLLAVFDFETTAGWPSMNASKYLWLCWAWAGRFFGVYRVVSLIARHLCFVDRFSIVFIENTRQYGPSIACIHTKRLKMDNGGL